LALVCIAIFEALGAGFLGSVLAVDALVVDVEVEVVVLVVGFVPAFVVEPTSFFAVVFVVVVVVVIVLEGFVEVVVDVFVEVVIDVLLVAGFFDVSVTFFSGFVSFLALSLVDFIKSNYYSKKSFIYILELINIIIIFIYLLELVFIDDLAKIFFLILILIN
jgi:hypothetical protein